MIDIEYDTPIEVTPKQYVSIRIGLKGFIAHRIDSEGRYWIKLWYMKAKDQLKMELSQ